MKLVILTEKHDEEPIVSEYEIMEVERINGRVNGRCPYCNTPVSHGDGNGMRVPHCDCIFEYFVFNKDSPDLPAFEDQSQLIRDFINHIDSLITFELEGYTVSIMVEETELDLPLQTHLAQLLPDEEREGSVDIENKSLLTF